jgi:CRISPR-associated endonuclease/helicase Cas3
LRYPDRLGKTSVVVIWLLALTRQAQEKGSGGVRLPRRLVYVVDRRTVVDQATDIAEGLRKALKQAAPGSPAAQVRAALERLCIDPADTDSLLAISTLRGERADNGRWRADPARPAIIIGTVDMIGSRLLFSAYGVSRRMRPFHAGLIGQDALIVHDEAHLSPAFGNLIRQIRDAQAAAKEPRPIRVMDLSATQRDATPSDEIFALTAAEEAEERVAMRLRSAKTLRFVQLDGAEPLADAAVRQAEALEETHPEPKRVVVYVRSPKEAATIAERLGKRFGPERVALLAGTIRGVERDQMANPAVRPADIADTGARRRAEIFRGFRARPKRDLPAATEYLVSTSAGEVGVDLDADHMIADLTTLDSIIQRLGRVNRLGEGAALVVVILTGNGSDERGQRLAATLAALQSLPSVGGGHDASPRALRALVRGLGRERLAQCLTESPRLLELTDILLDGWALTRIEKLPGRPQVDRWLHGVTRDHPSTYVAWREEIDEVLSMEEPAVALRTLFDKHRLLGHERVRGARDDVIEELKPIARRLGEGRVVLVPASGAPEAVLLEDLLKKDGAGRLREATVVLPPHAGGLSLQGMLDGSVKEATVDVADRARERGDKGEATQSDRVRVLLTYREQEDDWEARLLVPHTALDTGNAIALRQAVGVVRRHPRLQGMAETARIVLARDDEENETKVLLLLTRRGSLDAAEETQETASQQQPVELDRHSDNVKATAGKLAALVGLPEGLRQAVAEAAKRHDTGKHRRGWQQAIGHPPPPGDSGGWVPWAKSGQRGFDESACGGYRHEFGSLREATADTVLAGHPERDLVLHLIAAHHGWARPHFEEEHWDIAEDVAYGENEAIAAETLCRYARLQRRFGRWGLAWLESLVRAADHRVSSGVTPEWWDMPAETEP